MIRYLLGGLLAGLTGPSADLEWKTASPARSYVSAEWEGKQKGSRWFG